MVKVAVIGASGYTGAESIELLLRHEQAEPVYLSALPEECGPVGKILPRFRGRCELEIELLDAARAGRLADAVLCCMPHKESMAVVPKLLGAGLKVIDFSADYRLKDPQVYRKFYQVKHTDPKNLERAVFGLPELYRDLIRNADLVANPGCFPTGAVLALAPLLKKGLIDTGRIIVNAVTGISGAGRRPSEAFHFPNMNENIFPYGVGCHRHMPEMEQVAAELAGQDVAVLFQPHAGPFDRGILSSVYCRPKTRTDNDSLRELFRSFYRDERFVQVGDRVPAVKDVTGTNCCHLFPTAVKGEIIVFSAIDNLLKGASGQAVQNLNIVFGLDETLGLR
jgi:N-acetyl-gamma-glutamyl-phosphate reductase